MVADSVFNQLKHPNPAMRQRAMIEIVDNRDEQTIPKLMAALGEDDVVYRRACVKTLGAIGMASVPRVVEQMINSENDTVRASCAKAMAQIAVYHPDEPFPIEGLDGLRQAMNDPYPVVQIASVMSLGEVGVPAVDTLLEALKTTDNVAIALTITNTLGSIGDPRALEVLRQLITDDSVDSYIRETAESALPRLEQIIATKEAKGSLRTQ
ncbi:PBS lyase HEAT-like repeat domain protein [Synechococcus sp. PCC 7335]|uniref:HEAT repeat domain-containing protein n=1 Tax=Synechococcus sp. (strain ATCC 29403 / PCC 7335) TaxID=91464 RepID=UPI00017ED90E|nr:HEAT repeat domain-containing protein [Synechococcus sp. PCC 7335]EDX84953.1 PBS lyase HEAT-like repeat domain protein [Synechococcus sp. PCC 7335]